MGETGVEEYSVRGGEKGSSEDRPAEALALAVTVCGQETGNDLNFTHRAGSVVAWTREKCQNLTFGNFMSSLLPRLASKFRVFVSYVQFLITVLEIPIES